MGVAGTDAALETADVALMADELLKIPYAVRLSRATVRNIRANIVFSLVLKGAFLVLAVMGIATLWMAVVADMGASLIVIGNALRLLRE
jgi:Cd2+/Zn2+-exporting ATPase